MRKRLAGNQWGICKCCIKETSKGREDREVGVLRRGLHESTYCDGKYIECVCGKAGMLRHRRRRRHHNPVCPCPLDLLSLQGSGSEWVCGTRSRGAMARTGR